MKPRIGLHLESPRPDAATTVAWVLLDAEAHVLGCGRCALADVRQAAGPAAADAPVDVFAAGDAVMLTEVTIPSREAAHLRKALPYMVEEHVLGDLRETHLAIPRALHGNRVPVAVIAHAQMIAWLDALHGAGLSPATLIPEQLLLPRETGAVHVHMHAGRALLRLGDYRGVVVDAVNLVAVLALALAGERLPCSRVELGACVESPEDVARLPALASAIEEHTGRPVVRRACVEPLVEILAAGMHRAGPWIDLCQGGYAGARRDRLLRDQWRRAGLAVAACLAVLLLGGTAASAWIEHRAESTHEAAVARFRELFPDEPRIVNLRRQAQARLALAAEAGGGELQALAALARVLDSRDAEGVSVRGLEFRAQDGVLEADLAAASLERLYRLETLADGAGIGASLGEPLEEGGLASASLQLRVLP